MPATPVIDTPAYAGQSPVRIIMEWHNGDDYRITEICAYSTRTALEYLLAGYYTPASVIDHMVGALGRPNDAHTVREYDLWSWARIYQVWARDTAPARDVIAAEREHEATRGALSRGCALSRAAHYAPEYARVVA